MPTEVSLTSQQFLTERELAELLRIAPSSVRNIRARGEITFTRVGTGRGRVVYRTDDVQRFIERNRRVAAAEAA
jgi:excisionase family DNA binding protein